MSRYNHQLVEQLAFDQEKNANTRLVAFGSLLLRRGPTTFKNEWVHRFDSGKLVVYPSAVFHREPESRITSTGVNPNLWLPKPEVKLPGMYLKFDLLDDQTECWLTLSPQTANGPANGISEIFAEMLTHYVTHETVS